jgi:mannose-1-phosphate guanylyltransferase / mannose-6-phosphate isomerase
MKSEVKFIPLILAGGEGKRLWPVSNALKPKQFQPLVNGQTLLETTLKRCESDIFDPCPIIVSAAGDFGQFPQVDMPAFELILESYRRSTCAAIIAGTLHAASRDPNALVLAMPCDHIITDMKSFEAALFAATPQVEAGAIVTFGITPTQPASGYGYILPEIAKDPMAFRPIATFVEKPDPAVAAALIAEGALWNSGIFAFKANALLQEASQLAPDILHHVRAAYGSCERTGKLVNLNAVDYAACPSAAFDKAIMEKTDKGFVLPSDFGWVDVGSWEAVDSLLIKDEHHNHAGGNSIIHQSKNVTVHTAEKPTVIIGCEDIIVVTTKNAVLVVKKGASESVKDVVDTALKSIVS